MTIPFFPPEPLRDAFRSSLPEEVSQFGSDPPEVKYLYLPRSHIRALQPDNMLVVGMRGAGKSLWWSALQSKAHREVLSRNLPTAGIGPSIEVSPGFGQSSNPNAYPSRHLFSQLLSQFQALDIWRAILTHHVVKSQITFPTTWADKVRFCLQETELLEHTLYAMDQHLHEAKSCHLVLFDALDLVADNWEDIRHILSGLLRTILEFRSYKAIRAKAFVRPDMLEDERIFTFPDASKLETNKVELTWPRIELYSLLWQYLGNAPRGGEIFRDQCQTLFGQKWLLDGDRWIIPDQIKTSGDLQRRIFHRITGEWMGRDHRRGFPYTWLPNHLADVYGLTSPRSFLSALRKAAFDNLRAGQKSALHYEGIKIGVQEASTIRVREITEDYPWADLAMRPLQGLVVPCHYNEIEERWISNKIIEHIEEKYKNDTVVKLPPRSIQNKYPGICADLEALGLFQQMHDGRINIPDVYRIGFNLKRRGGVKPVR